MVGHSSYGIYGIHGRKQMKNEKKVVSTSTLASGVNVVSQHNGERALWMGGRV